MIPSQIEDDCPVKRLLHSLPDTFLELICHNRTGTPDQELRFRSQRELSRVGRIVIIFLAQEAA